MHANYTENKLVSLVLSASCKGRVNLEIKKILKQFHALTVRSFKIT